MSIYLVNIEHKKMGRNYRKEKIASDTFAEAVKEATSHLAPAELIESVELLEATD